MANGVRMILALEAAALRLKENRVALDALNVFPIPDGDTGSNMSATLNAAVQVLSEIPADSTAGDVMDRASSAALLEARGNSGVILSVLMRGFYRAVRDCDKLSGGDIAAGLTLAAQSAYDAVIEPVEGTMLTIAQRAAKAAGTAAKSGGSTREVLMSALRESEAALAETPLLLPALQNAGVVDAGANGLVLMLQAFLGVGNQSGSLESASARKKNANIPCETTAYSYCVNFALKANGDTAELREYLSKMGDSLVFLRDAELFKVHLHTNFPEVLLKKAEIYGEIVSTKIENIFFS